MKRIQQNRISKWEFICFFLGLIGQNEMFGYCLIRFDSVEWRKWDQDKLISLDCCWCWWWCWLAKKKKKKEIPTSSDKVSIKEDQPTDRWQMYKARIESEFACLWPSLFGQYHQSEINKTLLNLILMVKQKTIQN